MGPRYQKVGTPTLPLGTVHVPIPPTASALGTSDLTKFRNFDVRHKIWKSYENLRPLFIKNRFSKY